MNRLPTNPTKSYYIYAASLCFSLATAKRRMKKLTKLVAQSIQAVSFFSSSFVARNYAYVCVSEIKFEVEPQPPPLPSKLAYALRYEITFSSSSFVQQRDSRAIDLTSSVAIRRHSSSFVATH